MKKVLLGLLLSTAVFQASAAPTIRLATEATYPPFEYIDSNNQLTGFDVELGLALCSQMKADCSFANEPFDSLIPGLKFHRFDAIISGMDITPQRQKVVDFAGPYIANSAVFIAKTANFADQKALLGKTIGVQNGSTHQAYLVDKLESQGVNIRPYSSYQNALLDMTNGRVDAVFADTAVASDYLKNHASKDYGVIGQAVTDAKYFGIGMGIAVRKGDALKARFDTALVELKANGTYQQLVTKYFGIKG